MLITTFLIFALLLAADLFTKATICPAVIEAGGSVPFIPGLIRFEYTKNTGMAWGMLSDSTLILTIISLIACIALAFVIIKLLKKMPTAIRLALVLILAGAAGNLYDRAFLGYVRDFIAFDFMSFPIFNFADSCVTVGGILLVVSLIFTKSGRSFYKNFEKLFEGRPKEEAGEAPIEGGKGE
ncbi:MAG: signal peptidase II [Clostridia bacterium]|nr:signal peptidase II [Clostridia bacterium]